MKQKNLFLLFIAACIVGTTSCNGDNIFSGVTNNDYDPNSNLDNNQGSSTYVIELSKFNITLDGNYKDSLQTRAITEGINKALKYAKENGFTTIKFPKGEYAIQSEWGLDRWAVPNIEQCPWKIQGIVVPSDMTLDLTDATFRLKPNNRYIYSLFYLHDVKNVTIKGGHLIGDRYEHTYQVYPNLHSDSHEFGFGINIVKSENIRIEGTKIEKMTGDAVILAGYERNERPNVNVTITGCELFDCRRQGISVVSAEDCVLSYNNIYNIEGTDPQYGIDIEPETAWGLVANRIYVHDNYIKDTKGAISCHSGNVHRIFNNTVHACIIAVYSNDVKIYNNKVIGSYISAYPTSQNVSIYENTPLPAGY